VNGKEIGNGRTDERGNWGERGGVGLAKETTSEGKGVCGFGKGLTDVIEGKSSVPLRKTCEGYMKGRKPSSGEGPWKAIQLRELGGMHRKDGKDSS